MRGGSDDFELPADIGQRLRPPRQVERLPDPLRNGHVARARHALDFSVFSILQDQLQSLSHVGVCRTRRHESTSLLLVAGNKALCIFDYYDFHTHALADFDDRSQRVVISF